MEEYFLLHYTFTDSLFCKSTYFRLQKISTFLNFIADLMTLFSVNQAGEIIFPLLNKWRFRMKIPFTWLPAWLGIQAIFPPPSYLPYFLFYWDWFTSFSSVLAQLQTSHLLTFFCPKIKYVGNSLGFSFSKCCTIL